MNTKLVLRLLDADGQMLGATVHYAAVKGDGCLRAVSPVIVTAERSGKAKTLSIHWCDVNVETRVSIHIDVCARVPTTVSEPGVPLIVVGETPKNLPPITMRESVVVVPVGNLGVQV